MLHSFKNAQQLRVGVRDILGKERIEATSRRPVGHRPDLLAADRAGRIRQAGGQAGRADDPNHPGEVAPGEPESGVRRCELIIVALGKFGGRELNYYSDLDLIFLYRGRRHDRAAAAARSATTTTSNQHFFCELGQRIIKVATQLGPYGRLYQIDPRLRPTGKSGALAVSLAEFSRYFATGEGQLWERQALCKARVVLASPAVGQRQWPR